MSIILSSSSNIFSIESLISFQGVNEFSIRRYLAICSGVNLDCFIDYPRFLSKYFSLGNPNWFP